MFPGTFFPSAYFAPRYWPEVGASVGYGHTLYIATPSASGDGVTLGGGLLNEGGEGGGQA